MDRWSHGLGAPQLGNGWLQIDREARSVKLSHLPDDTAVPFTLNVQLVIEFYALSA